MRSDDIRDNGYSLSHRFCDCRFLLTAFTDDGLRFCLVRCCGFAILLPPHGDRLAQNDVVGARA